MFSVGADKKDNISCDYTHNYSNKAFEFLRVCNRYQLMLTPKMLALLSSWFSHVLPPDKAGGMQNSQEGLSCCEFLIEIGRVAAVSTSLRSSSACKMEIWRE